MNTHAYRILFCTFLFDNIHVFALLRIRLSAVLELLCLAILWKLQYKVYDCFWEYTAIFVLSNLWYAGNEPLLIFGACNLAPLQVLQDHCGYGLFFFDSCIGKEGVLCRGQCFCNVRSQCCAANNFNAKISMCAYIYPHMNISRAICWWNFVAADITIFNFRGELDETTGARNEFQALRDILHCVCNSSSSIDCPCLLTHDDDKRCYQRREFERRNMASFEFRTWFAENVVHTHTFASQLQCLLQRREQTARSSELGLLWAVSDHWNWWKCQVRTPGCDTWRLHWIP